MLHSIYLVVVFFKSGCLFICRHFQTGLSLLSCISFPCYWISWRRNHSVALPTFHDFSVRSCLKKPLTSRDTMLLSQSKSKQNRNRNREKQLLKKVLTHSEVSIKGYWEHTFNHHKWIYLHSFQRYHSALYLQQHLLLAPFWKKKKPSLHQAALLKAEQMKPSPPCFVVVLLQWYLYLMV